MEGAGQLWAIVGTCSKYELDKVRLPIVSIVVSQRSNPKKTENLGGGNYMNMRMDFETGGG